MNRAVTAELTLFTDSLSADIGCAGHDSQVGHGLLAGLRPSSLFLSPADVIGNTSLSLASLWKQNPGADSKPMIIARLVLGEH